MYSCREKGRKEYLTMIEKETDPQKKQWKIEWLAGMDKRDAKDRQIEETRDILGWENTTNTGKPLLGNKASEQMKERYRVDRELAGIMNGVVPAGW
jgi:hypothetical protein